MNTLKHKKNTTNEKKLYKGLREGTRDEELGEYRGKRNGYMKIKKQL